MTYELRTYTAAEGRMEDLLTRFRDHTIILFPEYGMESIGYWISEDDPNVLIYLVKHQGDAVANWAAFQADPRWITARTESMANGAVTTSIHSVYLRPTDFSPLTD